VPQSQAQQLLAANPNLSPGVAGLPNTGYMQDRLGNRILSPAMVPGFAGGGEASIEALTALANASNMADEEEGPKVSDYVSQARQMLSQVEPERRAAASMPRGPGPSKGGAQSPKEMDMVTESLATLKDYKPKGQKSAKAQLRELARQYALKHKAATEEAKGLSKSTFGAPTLEKPSLVRESLSVKRFEKGGEAKKPEGGKAETPFYSEGLSAPSVLTAEEWATTISNSMYPMWWRDQEENAKRDAARHMLASAVVAHKTSPYVAQALGKAHELYKAPLRTFGHWLGVSDPRPDYPTDVHNNALGAELRGAASDLRELERRVMDAISRGSKTGIEAGRVSLVPDTGASATYVDNPGQAQPPQYDELEKRAKGSPEEGEVSDPEAALIAGAKDDSAPAMSNEEFIRQAAYGLSDVPYVMAGAPVDLATMVMRPFGYETQKPVLGSEWIKEKMTAAGVRPPEATEERLQGPRQAAELLGSLVNPAAATRSAVKAAQVAGEAGKAGAKEVGRQLDRAIMEGTGPLARTVPEAAKPMYAVRPEGSMMFVDKAGDTESDLGSVLRFARISTKTDDPEKSEAITNFWDTKAKNYFERQFGTESDPIYRAIAEQSLRSPILQNEFPSYILDSLKVGKERVHPVTGESRFFPKYPEAGVDARKRYDALTGTTGLKYYPDRESYSTLADPDWAYSLTTKGKQVAQDVADAEVDKMLGQGTPIDMANVNTTLAMPSLKEPGALIGPYGAKDLLHFYNLAKSGEMPEGLTMPQKYITAIDKGEVIYASSPAKELKGLFDYNNINEYLAGLSAREIGKIRFEDAVKGGAKVGQKNFERDLLRKNIRDGKRVNNKFFEDGVSAPLYQVPEGMPHAGYAWKRITDPEATVAEGAWVGHSVGGYAKGGEYGPSKNRMFEEGKYQVYTLRDNRNRPVTTLEVRMDAEDMPVVTQLRGNGKLTGNQAAVDYDQPVYDFLTKVIKPVGITEYDSFLTPMMQALKIRLSQQGK